MGGDSKGHSNNRFGQTCTDLDFKGEILFHVFDDHDEERELDTKGFLWIGWTRNIRSAERNHLKNKKYPPYLTLVPHISNTSDCMSLSVILLMCPLRT